MSLSVEGEITIVRTPEGVENMKCTSFQHVKCVQTGPDTSQALKMLGTVTGVREAGDIIGMR